MTRIFRIEFPALDRLVAFLEADQQKDIDALTKQVQDFTLSLKQSRMSLEGTIQKEKTNG